MKVVGPTPDPGPIGAEPARRGADRTGLGDSVRWLVLVAALVAPASLAQAATRSMVGEGALAPFAGALGSQAWGLVAGIAGATVLGFAGRRVPRPAAAILAVLWLAPVAVLGLSTDLRAFDADPDLAVVVAVVAAALVMAIALVGWSVRLSARLTLVVIAGSLGGAMGAATTAALAGRTAGRPLTARTGRELAMVGPLVVLLPVLLVALVGAIKVRLLPEAAGGVFHVLALGGPAIGTGVDGAAQGQVEALRLAIVVPLLAALALGARAADRPSATGTSGSRGSLGGWGPFLIGIAVLGAAVLMGTAAAASGAPVDRHGPVLQFVMATSFVAVGLHAPTRAPGPWSPKLVLVVGVGAAWLVVLALMAALAVSGRP